MSLDPIVTTSSIESSYLRYLATTFRFRDAELQAQFEAELHSAGKFVKGPILEATPPYFTGDSIIDLLDQKLLSPEFHALETEALPLERPLYQHQERAIRKSILEDRNVVIATGTGSGKTEAFLIPVLNHLMREKEEGTLSPGVRALFLYPMNALANDQVARLREVLKNGPEITFGRYTGETEEKTTAALEKYNRTFRREPLSNELISREQMRAAPPHILLTNYAMLEYLLLRPADNVFFDGDYSNNWRYLVIDEAHTYSGAKGIEMAMLLRRLKDRVVEGEHGRLRCFATSATLGSGEEDYQDIANFAARLFDEQFEWVEEEEGRQDVLAPARADFSGVPSAEWSASPEVYVRWSEALHDLSESDAFDAIREEAIALGIPEPIIEPGTSEANGRGVLNLLHALMKSSADVASVRAELDRGPRFLDDLATMVFKDHELSKPGLVALVELSAKSTPSLDEQPILPARYHLFARAIEGAFISLGSEKKLYLERRETDDHTSDANIVFEVAVCRQCGASYLVGELDDAADKTILRQPGKQSYENLSNLKFFLLLDETEMLPDDEDELVRLGEEPDTRHDEVFIVCGSCAAIDQENLLTPLCNCETENYHKLMHVNNKKGRVHSCLACGSKSPSGLVSRFLTGNDATASVLATALYQQIPPRQEDSEISSPSTPRDSWSSTSNTTQEASEARTMKGQGRQLLIFSDSRQDAAFFAPYLNRTYTQILRRRLILEVLAENSESVIANRWRAQDLLIPLQRKARSLGMFKDLSVQEQEGEIWKWILHELLGFDRRNSLEGLGLLGFSLVKPQEWKPPQPLLDIGLREDEVWTLYQVLIGTARRQGAVLFPDTVSPEDEFFSPRNREYFIRENGSNANKHIFSWNPSAQGATNSRLDFIHRLFEYGIQIEIDRSSELDILRNIWSRSLELDDPASAWYDYFSSISLRNEGVVYRIKSTVWELAPSTVDENIQWHHCPTCNRLSIHNLRGICPTYRCSGRLSRAAPSEIFADNHYRHLYSTVKPIELEAQEHTAQLSGEAAARLQSMFMEGHVNALSCSTTFELGVDVGQLETVFMRNVPPAASNYLQRAGRAGRRTASTALALTFAQRRPHDLSHFNDPMRMITGQIRAPQFRIENEKVVLRHVYATALTSFWKDHPSLFKSVEAFFFQDGSNGAQLVADYLATSPESLRTSLRRIVPRGLVAKLDVENWGWVDGLVGSESGVLTVATQQVWGDVARLNEARDSLVSQGKASDFILRVINTIKRKYLLSYLSSQNVIPKYGFPVDVVSLQVLHHADEAKGLELDRDLRIAISEYAPSGQVVAGGKLWTSRYVKRLPDRGWRKYQYAVCDECGRYHSILTEGPEEELGECRGCGQELGGRNRGTFIVPEFGFITHTKPPSKPGNSRPERTYSSRTFFKDYPGKETNASLDLNGVEVLATAASNGELAVINHAGYQGFLICNHCGYSQLGREKVVTPHETPWWTECNGQLNRIFLGHEYKTDILQLEFQGHSNSDRGFWLSLLYGMLDGVAAALEIDRQDLDGCLYSPSGDPSRPALVLFDDVPGGAGHVRRVAESADVIRGVLEATVRQLNQCTCGGELKDTSCYGCLRNYRNQYCHDELARGPVIDFVSSVLS